MHAKAVIHTTDHPHGRGENDVDADGVELLIGPSPRAWGERDDRSEEVHAARIIPTGVGRTVLPMPRPSSQPDHPHGRGENWRGLGAGH